MFGAKQHGKSNIVHRLIQKAHLNSTFYQTGHVVQLSKEKGTKSERLTLAKEGNRRGQFLMHESEHHIPQDAVVCEKGLRRFGFDLTCSIPIPIATSPQMRSPGEPRVTFSDHNEKHQNQIGKKRRWPRFSICSPPVKTAEHRVMPDHVNSIPDIQVWDIDDSETFTQVMVHFTLT